MIVVIENLIAAFDLVEQRHQFLSLPEMAGVVFNDGTIFAA
jgi:hypothetical protein